MRQWTVQDVMTREVVSVRVESPYQEIVDVLARHRVSAVPVTDDLGRVLGVVSEADLLHKVEFIGDDRQRVFEWGTKRVNRAKAHAATAAELMTAPAVTIQPDAALVTAAKRMADAHVKRLPVVSDLGRLIGIVSRGDLLKMYLRPDHEVRHDVVDGVLRRILCLEPLVVQVDVTDGVVTLTGTLDRRSTAAIAATLTRTVPGVVRVVDRMAYDFDDTAISVTTGL